MRRRPAHSFAALFVAAALVVRVVGASSGLIAHRHAGGDRVHVHPDQVLDHRHDDDRHDDEHAGLVVDHDGAGIHSAPSDPLHWHAIHVLNAVPTSPAIIARLGVLDLAARLPVDVEPGAWGQGPVQPRAPPDFPAAL